MLLIAVAAAVMTGCGEAPLDEAAWTARGAETLEPFKQRLRDALEQGLADGPEQAIEICRLQAPGLAAASSAAGVTLGRTSHKLRNPANAPAPWMRALLNAYRSGPAPQAPRAVGIRRGRVGYVEPIYVQPPCLACHGEALAPAVQERLAALYPEDRATGFRDGDFRGLFWVEFETTRPDGG